MTCSLTVGEFSLNVTARSLISIVSHGGQVVVSESEQARTLGGSLHFSDSAGADRGDGIWIVHAANGVPTRTLLPMVEDARRFGEGTYDRLLVLGGPRRSFRS